MAPPPPAAGQKAQKHYILEALTATLAAAILVSIFFIVLSPARVRFSVTQAGSQPSSDGGLQLTLTLAADNPSRRAAVRYESLLVEVSNNTWPPWARASVAPGMPLNQPPASVVTLTATVAMVGKSRVVEFTGNMTSNSFSVRITAVVQFRVGVMPTRLYDIKLICAPVSFFPAAAAANNQSRAAVECDAAAPAN